MKLLDPSTLVLERVEILGGKWHSGRTPEANSAKRDVRNTRDFGKGSPGSRNCKFFKKAG